MQAKQALRHHNFISQKRAWYDPSRDILATKYALELGVKNPLQVIEESGLDPNEVLDGWALWKQLCEKKDLSFNDGNNSSNNLLDPIEDKSDEEQMQETGIKN
jgi:capsid protein